MARVLFRAFAAEGAINDELRRKRIGTRVLRRGRGWFWRSGGFRHVFSVAALYERRKNLALMEFR
jgi:hypothetical protein